MKYKGDKNFLYLIPATISHVINSQNYPCPKTPSTILNVSPTWMITRSFSLNEAESKYRTTTYMMATPMTHETILRALP